MRDGLGVSDAINVRIEKRVPHGAGLGGGSSDAAAVIAALCHLNGISHLAPEALAVARSLGADVSFFLTGAAALLAGRGDELVRVLPPARVPVAIVKPSAPAPTAQAYREFDRHPVGAGDPAALVSALESGRLEAAAMSNNLEDAAIALVPESADALALAAHGRGVLAAHVSGSGSSVFAVCDDADSAAALAAEAHERGWWSTATWTATEGVSVASDGDV